MKLLKYNLFIALLFVSCKSEFEPVSFGMDACAFCKMTIMDKRYAAEAINAKGKVFKYDDLICMKNHLAENNFEDSRVFIAHYTGDGNFLDGRQAVYLHHEFFASPMNGNYAAFADSSLAESLRDSLHAEFRKWDEIR